MANVCHAQCLGLQEKPEHADPLFSELEVWAARWGLLWFWTLPVSGMLMLIGHPLWSYAAMIGGGVAVDTGGREAAKVLGLRRWGVRTGSAGDYWLAMGTLGLPAGVDGVGANVVQRDSDFRLGSRPWLQTKQCTLLGGHLGFVPGVRHPRRRLLFLALTRIAAKRSHPPGARAISYGTRTVAFAGAGGSKPCRPTIRRSAVRVNTRILAFRVATGGLRCWS